MCGRRIVYRGFLKINLKRNGYEVIEVDNGEDGIKIAINEKPAIVILDAVSYTHLRAHET